jgi:F-type H+-transporting ATPase subunit b
MAEQPAAETAAHAAAPAMQGAAPVETTAMTEAHGGAEHEVEPSALGLAPGAWVALSMTVLIAVALFLKVPKMLTGMLDSGIADIRKQLDEAKALRAEAEALRKEYADKIAGAEKDAAAMLEHAKGEADAIVAKAQADTTAMIGRREQMATDKIAAAQNGAVAELRAKAADAASTAARKLIVANHGASADKALVDQAIAGI